MESAGAACTSMSIGGHEKLACVACSQSQSLCGECTTCLEGGGGLETGKILRSGRVSKGSENVTTKGLKF